MTRPSELIKRLAANRSIEGHADTTDHVTPVLVLVILIGAYYAIRTLS